MAKHRRRRRTKRRTHSKRRRNPAFPWLGLGAAALGGLLIGGARYAADMSTLGRGWIGLITAGVGAGVGAGVSMVSPMAGAGVVGAGAGIGVVDGLSTLVAEPAAKTSDKTKGMGRVIDIAQMERIVDARMQQIQSNRGQFQPRGTSIRQRVA